MLYTALRYTSRHRLPACVESNQPIDLYRIIKMAEMMQNGSNMGENSTENDSKSTNDTIIELTITKQGAISVELDTGDDTESGETGQVKAKDLDDALEIIKRMASKYAKSDADEINQSFKAEMKRQ